MDHILREEIKRYCEVIKEYSSCPNEKRKKAIRLVYEKFNNWLSENNIQNQNTSITCKTRYKIYNKIESYLLIDPAEEEIYRTFDKFIKLLRNPKLVNHQSLLENKIRKMKT